MFLYTRLLSCVSELDELPQEAYLCSSFDTPEPDTPEPVTPELETLEPELALLSFMTASSLSDMVLLELVFLDVVEFLTLPCFLSPRLIRLIMGYIMHRLMSLLWRSLILSPI